MAAAHFQKTLDGLKLELSTEIYFNLPLKDLANVAKASKYTRLHAEDVAQSIGFKNLADIGETAKFFPRHYLRELEAYKFKDVRRQMTSSLPDTSCSLIAHLFRAIIVEKGSIPFCFKDDQRLQHLLASKKTNEGLSPIEQKLKGALQGENVFPHQDLLPQDLLKLLCLEVIGKNPRNWMNIPENFKRDEEFARAAARQDGLILHYMHGFQMTKTVVLTAVCQNGVALEAASDILKSDLEIVSGAVSQNGRALEYASDTLKASKEVVLRAVLQHGHALQWASKDLRSDKEIVLEAVRKNGRALGAAVKALRNDKEVVIAAISNDKSAIQFASEELQSDPEIKKFL